MVLTKHVTLTPSNKWKRQLLEGDNHSDFNHYDPLSSTSNTERCVQHDICNSSLGWNSHLDRRRSSTYRQASLLCLFDWHTCRLNVFHSRLPWVASGEERNKRRRVLINEGDCNFCGNQIRSLLDNLHHLEIHCSWNDQLFNRSSKRRWDYWCDWNGCDFYLCVDFIFLVLLLWDCDLYLQTVLRFMNWVRAVIEIYK